MLRWWSLAIAIAFLAVALVYPAALRPLNRAWFLFGMLLSKVMTPVVMGLLFVLTVVPTELIMRLRKRDLLNLKLDRTAKSYWIKREPPAPPATPCATSTETAASEAAQIKRFVVIERHTVWIVAGRLEPHRTCFVLYLVEYDTIF